MNQPPASLLRGLAERASRGVSFRRTLRTAGGARRIYVTPEASLRYWLPRSLNSDVPLCEFAFRHLKSGQKVWDIGANIGVFTYLASAAVGSGGRVLSVEADPFISQLLIRSSLDQPAGDAVPEIITTAVSDAITLADFGVTNRSRASNHLLSSTGCSQTGGVRFSFKVPCVTLDWLLEHSFPPEVVKMDIEGVEHTALAAAPRLLREVRPVFHLEVWSEIAESLGNLFRASSYQMFDGESDLGLTKPLESPPWCTIAVPAEKHGKV
jgi:FkbM family methyltransferase